MPDRAAKKAWPWFNREMSLVSASIDFFPAPAMRPEFKRRKTELLDQGGGLSGERNSCFAERRAV
jgi:hypothetical protein